MSEHDEQVQVCRYLDALNLLYFAVPNGIFLKNKKFAYSIMNKMKKEGFKNGVPDLFICEPNKTYKGLFVEMKKKKATPSDTRPEQLIWKNKLNNKGYLSVICKGFQEAKEVIDSYILN